MISPLSKTQPGAAPFGIRSTGVPGLWIWVVASCLLLAACGSRAVPVTHLMHRCLRVDGQHEASLALSAPGSGLLVVTLEERGLSVAAHIDSSAAASSPVARLGTIVLATETSASQSHLVHVHTDDDLDLEGEVCATAELIPPSQTTRVRAETASAGAAQAAQAGVWADAFAGYLAAARGYDQLGLPHRAAQARHAMAELAYRRFDNKRDTYALASLAIDDYGAAADPLALGALVELQAKALLDMPGGDPRRTAPEIRARLEAARRLEAASPPGVRELVRLDTLEGQLEYLLDAPEAARSTFSRVAERCREIHDWNCYGTASQDLGVIAEESNDYSSALAVYAEALKRLSPRLEPKLVADISNNMGRIQGAAGLFSGSERSHALALRQYAQLGDCPGVRRTLAWQGSLLVQIGTLGDAESDLDRAATLPCQGLLAAVRPALPKDLPEELPTRGSAEERAARLELCRHLLDPAGLASDNQLTVFDALLSLTDALTLEGELQHAGRCLQSARPYASTARAQMRWANARGELLLDENEAGSARVSFERSLRIADQAKIPAANEHRGAAQLGVVKSELLAGEPTPQTLPSALRALQSSMARGDIDQTVMSLRLIAAAYRKANRNTDAAHTLQVAVDLIEAVPIDELNGERRATYLATQHTVFAELTDLFASQASSEQALAWQAFSVSERGRARSLRYAVSQATQGAADSLSVQPAARYRQLLRQIVQTGSDPSAGSEHLLASLENMSRGQATQEEELDRGRLAQTLDKLGATLVEYAAGARDMFAFVLAADGLHVIRLGERADIAAAAGELRDGLRDSEAPAGDVRAAAQRLARLVLWPLRAYMMGRRLIFVPEDALHTIPFAVLPWSADSNTDLLLQHAETTTAPSALFLANVRLPGPAQDTAPRIALFGDPVFRLADWRRECVERTAALPHASPGANRGADDWTESLPSLPGTRTEVSMVARLARQTRPASHLESLLGCSADAAALRSAANGGADLLHIATHARVDAERPRLSALALTPDEGSSTPTSAFGLLDILGLKLKSRLVVLSACDTSRGRLLPGEGVLGPAQAFLQAGSAAVLASYWRVDDAATARFMQRFYTHLFAEHLPAAAALRSAQLDTARAAGAHTWAAFALYGWPDSSI